MDKEDDIIWRPFGIETPEEIARYDTLYEGVTPWMKGPLWNWMIYQLDEEQSENDSEFNDSLVERLFQQLRIPLLTFGEGNFSSALFTLCESNQLLPAIDFILAFSDDADADSLQRILDRSGSAWTIGNRIEGYKGLVRRVPKGVQLAADSIM